MIWLRFIIAGLVVLAAIVWVWVVSVQPDRVAEEEEQLKVLEALGIPTRLSGLEAAARDFDRRITALEVKEDSVQ